MTTGNWRNPAKTSRADALILAFTLVARQPNLPRLNIPDSTINTAFICAAIRIPYFLVCTLRLASSFPQHINDCVGGIIPKYALAYLRHRPLKVIRSSRGRSNNVKYKHLRL